MELGKTNGKVLISIVVPVKDGASTICQCLESVYSQSLIDQSEVIVIDSGSTDGTLELLKQFPIRQQEISTDQFNHGTTRNLGASLASGKFIVMTVQDAVPADNQWLEKMLRHFDDPEVAGVCGQQIVPHDKDKNPHEWFRPVKPPSIRSYQFNDFSEFESLSPEKKRWVCGWDDVNAMYRGSILRDKIPFEQTAFGEDTIWAKAAYKAGYKLVFDTSARVYHYHHTNYRQQFERKKIEYFRDRSNFDLIPKKRFPLKLLLLVVLRNFRYQAPLRWIWYNWMKILAGWRARVAIR